MLRSIPLSLFFAAACFGWTAAVAQPKPFLRPNEVRYASQADLGRGVTLAKTNSGLTVIVRTNRAAPIATVRCYVRNTGGAFEGKYLGMGLSHVLEHLVAGGSTTNRPETEIQAMINSLGGQSNAFTSDGLTGYYIDCPADGVEKGIDLVADWMQNAAFVDKEYHRELGVVQRELEMGETDRNRVAHLAMKALIYTEHPMRHPTIGYLSLLQSISRKAVVDFYRSRYVPQNLVFVVGGDVDVKKVLDLVLKKFQGFQRTTDTSPVLREEPEQASPRSTRLRMQGPTTNLSIAWPSVRLQHPDLYPLDAASYLLTNGESSRLVRRLRVEQPLAIRVNSSSYTPGFVKGWFQIQIDCAPENVEACRRIVFEEIARLQKELVPEKELDKVRRQTAASHVFGQQTVQSQADALGRSYIATGDPLFDDQYVKGIQRVTPEQIRAAARRYFKPERQNTVRIDPLGDAEKTVAKAKDVVESPVIKKRLPNGLLLLVKRHAVQPIVNVHVFARGGVIAETPETNGISSLTTSMMTKGTEKYSARDIAEYFDSVGGSISVASQRNTSYLQSSMLTDDFPAALERIDQVIVSPTFPEDEFAKTKQLQLSRIAARAGNPQADTLDLFVDRLPSSNPYSRRTGGKVATVKELTAESCRRHHARLFQPRNMVVAVYGDVDPEKTLAELEHRFGRLKDAASPPPEVAFGADHSTRPKPFNERVDRQREASAMVLLGYPTVSMKDEKTQAALSVVGSVLTAPGAGRLFRELRGERLVYYVFGFHMTGYAPGQYIFLAQTRPDTVDEVNRRIQRAIAKIEKEGVPAEELAMAKHMLIVRQKMSGATPSDQSFEAALDELYGRGFDYRKTYARRIEAVSSDDIKRVLKKYFHDPSVIVTAPKE